MKVITIIPAAGLGTRMGKASDESFGTSRKQFMLLAGSPIIIHTIRKFAAAPRISEIIVALRGEDIEPFRSQLAHEPWSKPVRVVEGGRSRQESVKNCLSLTPPDADLVAVHDAVRPFVTIPVIDSALDLALEKGAAIVGIPPVDTVKRVERNRVESTLRRERIVLAQTPQVFRFDLLKRAFAKADDEGFLATDEASLVEHLGEDVYVVLGTDRNIKITRPSDMALAEMFFQEEQEAAQPLRASSTRG